MNIHVIPDTHGSNLWKERIEAAGKVDMTIFLGDYVDSRSISNSEILDNLYEIIEYKLANYPKVELLLGNHELSYLYMDSRFSCSGFRPEIAFDIQSLIKTNRAIFKNAAQFGNTVFTHAGIHEGWFKYRFKGDHKENIAVQLNYPDSKAQELALYDVGRARGGTNKVGGIFWCDRNELKKPLRGYTQVVGHTPVKKYTHYQRYSNAQVYFIDCLEGEVKPFIINVKEKA